MKNIDMKGSRRRHVWMLHDLQCEIRGCTFHDGTGSYGPDRAYGIFIGNMVDRCSVACIWPRCGPEPEQQDSRATAV